MEKTFSLPAEIPLKKVRKTSDKKKNVTFDPKNDSDSAEERPQTDRRSSRRD